jgi:decaprenylphospho-beta-D-ribofuranose 2-oxidase
MALPEGLVKLTNWSKSAFSPCYVCKVNNVADITKALTAARTQHLSVIPHGAGHSYTDAALNTSGVVIDVTPMNEILSWDEVQGIIYVEPGVTLQQMIQVAWKDGWWPFASPSTSAVTIGGCTAMNVNGRNAWKYGPFGAHVLSLNVMFASGEVCTITPERDTELFQAFVGSMGLLGIITAITVQLERINSGYATVWRRSAASFDEIFSRFGEEEQSSDFMEAWLDGFARGRQFGRGIVTWARLINTGNTTQTPFPVPGALDALEPPLVRLGARLGRSMLLPGVQIADRANYFGARWSRSTEGRRRGLIPYTFWPRSAFIGYNAMFPEGVETFQAFLPKRNAKEIFEEVLRYSQQQNCMPIWCIIKQHRSDPFLLSYQVDGFSLELNYQRTQQTAQKLEQTLKIMIETVIEAGGRFYLAKDHFLTHAQYRKSVGDENIDTFLELKRRYDPEMVLQSDLFRRVFQPSLEIG